MATGIIPARLHSTRLPGKPLIEVGGRRLIDWVIQRVRGCRSLDRLIVATDDESIAAAARAAGAEAALTRADHPSGTDRIAEVAAGIADDLFVNVQGDEPEIEVGTIDAVVRLLEDQPDLDLATAAAPITELADFLSPHRVKVVTDARGRALYFSRAPIPHRRDAGPGEGPEDALAHVGIYGYRKRSLLELVALPPSPLEVCEKLEQLRALQAGMSIGVARVERATPGIDTPADLAAFAERLRRQQSTGGV